MMPLTTRHDLLQAERDADANGAAEDGERGQVDVDCIEPINSATVIRAILMRLTVRT
jgi:hypothetical protein